MPASSPPRAVLQLVVAAISSTLCLLGTASAQISELDPILLNLREGGTGTSGSASSLQVYRIPVGVTLLDTDNRPWGLRLTFPVSLGFYELNTARSVEDVIARAQTVAVAPGLEFLVPLGQRWMLKPYGEVSVGATTSGKLSEVQYSAGVKTRADYPNGPYTFTVGLGGYYASPRASHLDVSDYTTLEAALDVQRRLGFEVAGREARAGVYGIGRWFPGLTVRGAGDRIVPVERVMEVGLSFSTSPELALWKLPLPWIAVGYRFGDMFKGIRISFDFPF